MSSKQVNCKNCEQSFDGDFPFCPHCGQKVNDKLTIGVLFYNTISNYFSFDARFIKSFGPLLFKPGYLAKEFISGKRLLFLHPAQMYLFISVVFFFLFSFTVSEQRDILNQEFKNVVNDSSKLSLDKKRSKDSLERQELRATLEKSKVFTRMTDKEIDSLVSLEEIPQKNVISFGGYETELDSLIEINASDKEMYKVMGLKESDGWFKRKLYEQVLKFYKARDAGNIISAFYDTIPVALFFLLPIFAFIIKLFYFNKGTYVHHLVFSFYFFAFVFTVFSLIFGINLIYDIPDWIDFLMAMSIFVYLFMSLKHFYGQAWFLTFIKASLASFVFLPITGITAVAILFFAFMFY